MAIKISVLIVGGGIGGLATAIALRRAGHHVTVLEGARELSEVGAGIQIPPNSSYILDTWGLLEKIKEKAVWPEHMNIRRYANGKVISATRLNPDLEDKYGYPYFLIHRADYIQLLCNAATEIGAEVLVNAKVKYIDDAKTSVRLHNGTVFTADLIIGADGIRSKVRTAVIPEKVIEPRRSDNCAYRATVPAAAIQADSEISHLLENHNSDFWIGHRCHIVAYPIKGGKLYNIVMSHPGEASLTQWNESGNLYEMKEPYLKFDPIINKVLSKITQSQKWTLADIPPLSRWVSCGGHITLIGDAAHAMLPHLAQGAAQAIEDAATLGVLLSQIHSVDSVPDFLNLYEQIRRPRVERIQKNSLENGYTWHLPDGEEQIARDKAMREADELRKANSSAKVESPLQWSDGDFQPWLYGHDAILVAKKALQEMTRNGQIGFQEKSKF
ncbi:hypothetical protein INT47_009874 [Mucor saturninus]|uniref:FAD-binding domain-containing protein n=1 Tax=Mucor saturninus TaxID=64648 RepID=A0A8H7QVQ8_9FUNG|nr:hypothetical protein INT47_009874 [Mucor saturninus]